MAVIARGGRHEDEGRVLLEGALGLVVADRGIGLAVAGGALHIAQPDTLKQPDGDVGTPQRVRRHPPPDAGRPAEAVHDRRRVVWARPPAPLVAQQWPRTTSVDGFEDDLLGPCVQDDFGRLVALAQYPQGRLVAGTAKVGDVRAARLGDPQPVERKQAGENVGVTALILGGGQQVGQLVAVQPCLGPGWRCGRRTRAAALPTVTSSCSNQRNQELSVEMRPVQRPACG